MNFAHLHVHDMYSKLDGLCKTDELAQVAKELGMTAIAQTNHGSANGLYHFQKACDREGIKPILGTEFYIKRSDGKNGHIIALAKNNKGLENIFKMQEDAFVNNFYYKPRITFDVLKHHSEGLVVTSACLANDISQHIMNGEEWRASEEILKYKEVFGEDYYLELQSGPQMEQVLVNKVIAKLAQRFDVKTILTNDVHYIHENDWFAHEVVLALNTNSKMADEKRFKFPTQDYWLKTKDEMIAGVEYLDHQLVEDSCNNTMIIADKCNARIEPGNYLPHYHETPNGIGEEDLFRKRVSEGYEKRIMPNYVGEKLVQYRKDLDNEIEIIEGEGYSGYFLIVQDYVKSAIDRGEIVGQGRGSVAGCKSAFVMDIHKIDPEKYNLLFERFMAEGRSADIDNDFSNQDAVFKDLQDKYGVDSVARVITFGMMTPKAVIRKVMNCFGHPMWEIKAVTKLIDEDTISLKGAYTLDPQLKAFREKYRQEFDIAERLEGTISHEGKHAGGVVIYPQLSKYLPIKTEGADRQARIVGFDKYMLEELGFQKFDILGLKTLPIIDKCLKTMKDDGIDIDLDSLEMDDEDVYDIIAKGDVSGVFQLASQSAKVMEQKPETFDDLIAINALIRPGPDKVFPEYIARRNGKHYEIHKDRAYYMEDTMGLLVYQEQFLLDCKTFAGWGIAYSDKYVRKNRDIENDIDLANKFILDSMNNGYEKSLVEEIWKEIVACAKEYSFNKSHATSYAVLSYQTAYLKHYYPLHWYSAIMTVKGDDQDEVAGMIAECKNIGIPILPPDINKSTGDFIPSDKGILYRITTIKSVGDSAIDHLMHLRSERSVTSLDELVNRRAKRFLKNNVIVAMIKAGCFDFEDPNRAIMLWKFDMMNRTKTQIKNNFQCETYDYNDSVKTNWEKEVFGMYLSVHPMEKYGFKKIEEYPENEVLVGGEILDVSEITDKNGNKMAFIMLDTLFGNKKIVVFKDQWKTYKDDCRVGFRVLIKGKRSGNDVILNKMKELEEL